MKKILVIIGLLAFVGCNKSEKVWIVLDIALEDGTPAQMAFDNPSVPGMTLEECKASMNEAIPNLMAFVNNDPKLKGAKLVASKCAQSKTDPIKP